MSGVTNTRCTWCGYRWVGLPLGWAEHYRRGDRLPCSGEGKDLRCPQCGLGGSAVKLDFDPQAPLSLGIDPTVYKYQQSK